MNRRRSSLLNPNPRPAPEPVIEVVKQPEIVEPVIVQPVPVKVVEVIAPPPPAPKIDWLWYEDDLTATADPLFDMEARTEQADHHAEDAVIDGWIESVEGGSPEQEYPSAEDYLRNRPISA